MSLGDNFDNVLQAARVGAEWAWVELYRDLSPSVLRYIRAHGAKEPEDVLGEVFVGVVRSLASFNGNESAFRAWVFRSARNAIIDSWRRNSRQPIVFMSDDMIIDTGSADSAEAEVMQRLAYDKVMRVLSKLTEHQREVVFLRVLVGLSVEEVAQVVGKSSGSVKALQVRGLAALRREISREAVSK